MNDIPKAIAFLNSLYRQNYRERLLSHAQDPGSTWYINGWGSKESQLSRYAAICKCLPTRELSILDVGCGTGDLLEYIRDKNLPYIYTGFDLIPEMVEYAKRRHENETFFIGDVYKQNVNDQSVDFIVASGLLQYTAPQSNNLLGMIVKYLFDVSKAGVVINFLSALRDSDFKADGELYLDPADMVNLISQICKSFGSRSASDL